MFQLKDLPGIKQKIIDCKLIISADEIKNHLKKDMAITAAGPNGAINIWIDDKGFYRCQLQRFCITIELRTFAGLSSVIKWATKQLEFISRF